MKQVQKTKEWLPTAELEFKAVVKPKEYTDLIDCQSPKFLPFIDRYGLESLETIISITLTSLSEGLGFTVSGEMLCDSAELIIQEYPDTKLSDLLLFKSQMLIGRIGGQVEDKLWRWNTRSILQAWGEYYANREDIFCDYREQKNVEAKAEYNSGFARSFANATPEQQDKHKEYLQKLEQSHKEKREQVERMKEQLPQKMTLEEIAEFEGIDLGELAAVITKKAETRRGNNGEPLTLFASAEMASLLFEARQNPKYLHEYIKV